MWGQSARPVASDAVVVKTAHAHTHRTHTSQSSQSAAPTLTHTHHSPLAVTLPTPHISPLIQTHTGSPVPTGCHQSLPSSHTHTSHRPASRHCPPFLLPLIHSHLTHTAQQPPSPHQTQLPPTLPHTCLHITAALSPPTYPHFLPTHPCPHSTHTRPGIQSHPHTHSSVCVPAPTPITCPANCTHVPQHPTPPHPSSPDTYLNVCRAVSLPRCGARALAPSSPMLFS